MTLTGNATVRRHDSDRGSNAPRRGERGWRFAGYTANTATVTNNLDVSNELIALKNLGATV